MKTLEYKQPPLFKKRAPPPPQPVSGAELTPSSLINHLNSDLMLPPAARDTTFKALVSYLVSAEDMVDPCGCVFRYIGRQVRFCARIMVRNVAAQMRSASQPHGCLTEHHPYPAGILLPILLLVCLFF